MVYKAYITLSPEASMSTWSSEELEILKNNYEISSCEELQYLLPNRTKNSIYLKGSRLGLGNLWTDKEIKILKINYGKLKVKEFQKLIPRRNVVSIIAKARKLGLRSKLQCNIYSVNTHFFSNPNIINSYWAGWIAADGNLFKSGDNSYTFQARIHADDIALLEKFCIDTKFTGQIYRVKNKDNGDNKYIHLSIHSVEQWFKDLNKHFNIVPKKSLILQPPNLIKFQDKLSYIVGYIDGDGCITEFKPNNSKKYPILMITGTKNVLTWISNVLYELEDKNRFKPLNLSKNQNVYFIQCKRLRAINLISHLKLIKTPFKLNRKWNKLKDLHENIKLIDDKS